MSISFTEIGDRRLDDVLTTFPMRQVLLADGSVPDMRWSVITTEQERRALVFECGHLGAGGECRVYDRRPAMCRAYRCGALEGTETLAEMLAATSRENANFDGMWAKPLDAADVTGAVRARLAELAAEAKD